MDSAVGTVSIAATDVATTTIAETGLGFTPKVVLFWWSGRSESVDTIAKANMYRGIGCAEGTTSRWAVANRHDDNLATTDGGRRMVDTGCVAICDTAGANDGEADLSSFDADGFTLVIDTQFGVDLEVHYMALGGADVVSASTGFVSESDQFAATTAVTGVGFQPNFVLIAGNHAGDVTLPHASSESRFMIGMASGTGVTEQATASWRDEDAEASQIAQSYAFQGQFYNHVVSGTMTSDHEAVLGSFDADGFTLDWIGEANTDQSFVYLALNVTNAAVGLLNTRTDGADIAVTGLGFEPAAIGFVSHGAAESTENTKDATGRCSVGFAKSATERGAQMTFVEDGTDPSEVSTAIEFDAVYINPDAAHAIDGLMDLKSIDSGGFTAVMDDPDTSASAVLWFAFGSADVVLTPGPVAQVITTGV